MYKETDCTSEVCCAVRTAGIQRLAVLWYVTPCNLVRRYQRFEESSCLHLSLPTILQYSEKYGNGAISPKCKEKNKAHRYLNCNNEIPNTQNPKKKIYMSIDLESHEGPKICIFTIFIPFIISNVFSTIILCRNKADG
jgi:hypothetical protein